MSLQSVGGEADLAAARAVAVGTVAQLLSKAIHLALNVVATVALVRYLGPAGYGDYVFVVSFGALFGLLSDFGLPRVTVRELAREPRETPKILGSSLSGRVIVAILSWGLAQLVLLVSGTHADLQLALAVASLLFVGEALLAVSNLFQARLAMQYEAVITVVAQAVDTALILWLIAQHAGLVQLLAAPVFSAGIAATLCFIVARRRFHVRLAFDMRRAVRLLSDAWPVGLTVLLAVVYLKVDSVLLGVLSRQEEVGLYGAAYKPIEYLILASSVLVNPLFPLLARWHGVDMRRFELVFQRGTTALLAFLIPVPVILALVADPLVNLMYAADFAAAALPLRVLSVALVFVTFAVWQDFTLLSAGRQRFTLAYGAVGVAINIALNVLVIPRAGAVGASAVALVTGVFFSISAAWGCSRYAQVRPDPRTTLNLLVANGALGTALWLLLQVGLFWPVAVVCAAAVYPAFLLLCRVTSIRELRQLVPDTRQPILKAA